MKITLKDLSELLKCHYKTLHHYMNNWRFNKYRVPIKPVTLDIDSNFISDFNEFLLLQRRATTKQISNRLDRLAELIK